MQSLPRKVDSCYEFWVVGDTEVCWEKANVFHVLFFICFVGDLLACLFDRDKIFTGVKLAFFPPLLGTPNVFRRALYFWFNLLRSRWTAKETTKEYLLEIGWGRSSRRASYVLQIKQPEGKSRTGSWTENYYSPFNTKTQVGYILLVSSLSLPTLG